MVMDGAPGGLPVLLELAVGLGLILLVLQLLDLVFELLDPVAQRIAIVVGLGTRTARQ
jgi:hypothetical protein